MRKMIILAVMLVSLITLVGGAFEGVVIDPSEEISSFTVISHQNSSDFWDDLDVPTDIPNSEFWANDTSIVFDLWNDTWDTSGEVDTDSQYTHLTNFTDDMNLSINHTSTVFELWNDTWDTSGLVDTDSQYTNLSNFTDDIDAINRNLFDQELNKSDNATFYNITITEICIGSCYTEEDFTNYLKNQTAEVFSLWNDTWDNQGSVDTDSQYTHLTNFTDDMNLSINHTFTVFDLWNGIWVSTYNATYDLYAYNQTIATFNLYNSTWDQSSGVDEVDPVWTLNYSTGLFVNDTSIVFSLWNDTWDNSWVVDTDSQYTHLTNFTDDMNLSINHTETVFNLWNGIWVATYNASYDLYAYNETTATFDLYNDTWDQSGGVDETDPVWTLNWSLGYFVNDTSITFGLWNTTWDNSWVVDTDSQYTHLTNFTDDMNLSINHTETVFTLWNDTWDNQGAVATGDNVSWNQSFANELYAPNTTAGLQHLLNVTGIYADSNVSALCAAGEVQTGEDALLCLDLNVSIDAKVSAVFYNATSISLEAGTLDSGDVESTWGFNDADEYNISELDSQEWIIYVNWTGIVNFNNINLRYWYDATDDKAHHIHTCLWIWDESDWDCEYTEIEYSTHFVVDVSPVFDTAEHLGTGGDAGEVRLKLQHDSEGDKGRTTHDFYLDYITLSEGFTGFVPTGVPSLQSVVGAGNVIDGINIFSNANATFNRINATEFCIGSCYTESNFTDYLKNQTLEVFTLYNDIWISTYNATYDANVDTDSQYTHLTNFTDDMNLSINHTFTVFDLWNGIWISTFNDSYVSTYNVTYDLYSYNFTQATFNLYNSTWDQSGGVTEADPVWTLNWSLGLFVNDTSIVFDVWNTTWDNSFMSQWNHNQTSSTFDAWNDDWVTTFNDSYVSTYNATYAAGVANNSWNQTAAEDLFALVLWSYNQTSAAFDAFNDDWVTTFNDSYVSTFNVTYDLYSYNFTQATFNLYNSTWDQSGGVTESDPVWTLNYSTGLFVNDTSIVFDVFNSTWDQLFLVQWGYNQTVLDTDTQYSHLSNLSDDIGETYINKTGDEMTGILNVTNITFTLGGYMRDNGTTLIFGH